MIQAAMRSALEALKPCPFCGGAPEFENTDERTRLRCTGCGVEGGLFFFSQQECESGLCDATEARAIQAWNRRFQLSKALEDEGETPAKETSHELR